MKLLDSDEVIDILRQHPPAGAWLSSVVDTEELGVPGFVVLELIDGCHSKGEINQLLKAIKPFKIYWPTAEQISVAPGILANAHLSHNTGPLDMLIGATALGLGAPLCTFNVKHFRAIPGLLIEQPYKRVT